MNLNESTIVLRRLLDQIRQAHHEQRSTDLLLLTRDFITAAAGRLEALARRVIRKYAPDQAGATKLVFNSAYERLVTSLQDRLPPASPDEYFRIAAVQLRYALLDLIRGERRAADQAPDSMPSEFAANTSAPPEKVGRADFWECFLNVVEEMPSDLRDVFDLYWVHGMTHAEVAERLGVSEKQARMKWEKVKLHLRRHVGEFVD